MNGQPVHVCALRNPVSQHWGIAAGGLPRHGIKGVRICNTLNSRHMHYAEVGLDSEILFLNYSNLLKHALSSA
jgi:hypothetical protein